MSASLNKVFLIGNLTRDPELRYVPSGTAVATFTIAVNRNYKTQTGEKKDEVTFVRVVTWGRRAEVCGEYLSKGSPVFVEGRLRTRAWQTPEGQNRSTTEVIAQSIQFLSGGKARQRTTGEPEMASVDVDSIDLADGRVEESENQPKNNNDNNSEVPF